MPKSPDIELSRIDVFVVDDHEMVRMALTDFIVRQPDFVLKGQGAGDRQTLEEIRRTSPRVVSVDLEMPVISGSQFLEFTKALTPAPRILVCSMHSAPAYVVDAFRRGADGYVLKRSPMSSYLEALRLVAGGDGYIDPSLHSDVIRRLKEPDSSEPLSPEELDALRLAADGLTNEQIAERLGQSFESVKHRLKRVFQKLEARDRSHAVAIAFKRNLL